MSKVTGAGRQGTGHGGYSTGRRLALAGTAMGAALVPAGVAHATVLGAGNAVFDNSCTTYGGTTAVGDTATQSGAATGNQLGLPLSLPRNHCGSTGIVCTAVFMSSV
ncbi:chaplin family protein [Kitasatospora sp. NPDC059827]|uniref:chaplin family protein n=1 Tax=Kitasatospora sp. NPDC059827 TaxID=3346964 RepID=UPI00364F66D0